MAEATCAVTVPSPGSGLQVDRVEREKLARGHAAQTRSEDGVVSFVNAGRALDGYEVVITDQSGEPLPDRRVGEIVVRGPSLMRGYLGDDAATAAAIRDGWLLTGDLGYLVEGHLFVTGRVKDVIIVDGANYHASDIERIVERVPGIRPGGSAAIPIQREGSERLAVIAESRLEATAVEDHKRALQAAVLDETGVSPALVTLVPPRTLPKTTSGKMRRAEVRRMLDAGELVDLGGDALTEGRETTEIEEDIAAIWKEVLRVARIEPPDDFFELGGSSLQAATVVAEIGARLGVVLPLSALATTPTLAGLAARVERGGEVPLGSLVELRHAEAGPAIFAIPGGAGGVLDYRRLANALDGECSFYAFEPKGADTRSRPARSVEEMAEQYLDEMTRVSKGPYICLGYSFGGIVAYEMATRLASQGATSTRVMMLDTAVPTSIRPSDFKADKRPSAKDLYGRVRRTAALTVVRGLAWAHFNLRTPVSPRMFHRYLLDNARALTHRYVPQPYSGPVDYVQVQNEDDVPSEKHVRAWRTVASDLRTHRIRAPSHFHVLSNPWVEDLAGCIHDLWTEAVEEERADAAGG
ncbi:MAG TPA: alpha/beta fold hydrolase [Actinomycetota bacterium]